MVRSPLKRLVPILIVVLAYAAWPYYGIHAFGRAVSTGERMRLEEAVSFTELRAALKDELNAQMVQAMAVSEDPGIGGILATALAPHLVDSMVDAYVTPAGLSRLLANEAAAEESDGEEAWSLDWSQVDYAFFRNPSLFAVDLKSGHSMRFRLRDWSWKLVSIALPSEPDTSVAALVSQPSADPVVDASVDQEPRLPSARWRSGYDLKTFRRVNGRCAVHGISPFQNEVSFTDDMVVLRANSSWEEVPYSKRRGMLRSLNNMFEGRIVVYDHWTGEFVEEL